MGYLVRCLILPRADTYVESYPLILPLLPKNKDNVVEVCFLGCKRRQKFKIITLIFLSILSIFLIRNYEYSRTYSDLTGMV